MFCHLQLFKGASQQKEKSKNPAEKGFLQRREHVIVFFIRHLSHQLVPNEFCTC